MIWTIINEDVYSMHTHYKKMDQKRNQCGYGKGENIIKLLYTICLTDDLVMNRSL